jgi:hypothetical protein
MTVAHPPAMTGAPRAHSNGGLPRPVDGFDTQSGPICAAQPINTVAWLSAQIG